MVESRGPELVKTVWAEFGVATLVVCLRVYTTFSILNRVNRFAKAATYTVVLAWSIALLSNIFVQLSVDNGTGMHLEDIPKEEIPAGLLYSSVANFVSRMAIAIGKVAVILFLCAIQQQTQTSKQRGFLAFIAVSNILISIVLIFTIMFQCSPPRKLWHPEMPGNCDLRHVNNGYSFLVTAWGAASDVVLAFYPTYLFWSLQIDPKVKFGMSALFGLGLVAAVCACITCYQVHVLAKSSDPSYYKVSLTTWSFSEMWVIIIAASVPPTWPWVVTMFSNLTSAKRSVQRALPASWRSESTRTRETATREWTTLGRGREGAESESNLQQLELPSQTSDGSYQKPAFLSDEVGLGSPRPKS